MESIPLGSGGPLVSRVGLGLMGMSGIYGPADEAESIATIRAALDAGITLLDTGDFYGMGHNEMLLRDALRGVARDRVFIQVKFGGQRDPGGAFIGHDASPNMVKNSLAYSLQRLGTDYVDLYQPARLDPRGPDRGHGRRDRGDDRGGLRPVPRPVRDGRRDHPPGARRAPGLRAADRVLADEPRDRGGDPAHGPRARHRRHRLRGAVPRPAVDRQRPRDRPGRPAGQVPPVPGREPASATWTCWPRWRRSRRTTASPRPSWPSPGCCPAAPTSSRWSAPSAGTGWPRRSAPSTCGWTPRNWPPWRRRYPRARWPATATTPARWPRWTARNREALARTRRRRPITGWLISPSGLGAANSMNRAGCPSNRVVSICAARKGRLLDAQESEHGPQDRGAGLGQVDGAERDARARPGSRSRRTQGCRPDAAMARSAITSSSCASTWPACHLPAGRGRKRDARGLASCPPTLLRSCRSDRSADR